MADLKAVEQALNNYIRPLTFPVAIKMLKSEDEIPEKTRRPFQQLKKKVAICQGIGMARKLGWAVAMGKEEPVPPGSEIRLSNVLTLKMLDSSEDVSKDETVYA